MKNVVQMLESVIQKNWEIGTTPKVLENIVEPDVNITIYDRDIQEMTNEVKALMDENIEFRASGKIDEIVSELTQIGIFQQDTSLILKDIKTLLAQFEEISASNSFRLFLGTVNTNMCRKFHTDINDLRVLCTYSGQGTLWLTEDNINRNALNSRSENEDIVIDHSKVQQAKQGSVLILKGAIFPQENTRAVVHRSPTIEETGERRLLLRIDTNDFLNF